ARNVPEPIPVTRLVLTRDQPEIAADRLSTSKAVRIIHERGPRFGRADTHSRDAAQLRDGRRLLRLMIQLPFDPSHLAEEGLDLFEQQIPPQLLRNRGQGQLA